MKLSGIVAAIIAAATAITPITFNSPSLCAPYTAFAEDTGAVAVLPDWIPTDFDSAVNFRNTYGATHIENGLICIVYPQRVNKDSKEGKYGYDLKSASNMGEKLKQEIYSHDHTEICFNVFVYQPQKQGAIDLQIEDTHVMSEEGDESIESQIVSVYSFSVDQSLNITETDIYSWLPDSKTEYNEYVEKNGEVSAKDNYVVFCTMTIDQLGDKWSPDNNNKYENIKYLLTSDCTMQVPDLYDDGSVDKIYVYQAVKDGYEKISWIRTSQIRHDPEEPTQYTLTADCAVFDNGQSVLLADTARFRVCNGRFGGLIEFDESDKIFLIPNILYSSDSDGGYVGVDLASFQMTSNPYYWDISQYKDADIFYVRLSYNYIPDQYVIDADYSTVRKFDNGAVDYVFRLKNNNEISNQSTKITFYDEDTGELLEIPDNKDYTYLMRFKSGSPSASKVFDITSNPCTLDSGYVYEKSCDYSFYLDTKSGWYDSLKFEITSENADSIELNCQMKWNPNGDANRDGVFSVADVVYMQKWLLGSSDLMHFDWEAVDFSRDNRINAIDLVLMRKKLLRSINTPVAVSIEETGILEGSNTIRKVYREDDKYILYYKDLNSSVDPLIIEISEQDYDVIISQDYDAIIDSYANSSDKTELDVLKNVSILTYSDGSENETHVPMTSVIDNMKNIMAKYMEIQSVYVKPAHYSSGPVFAVSERGMKLYSGPGERYRCLAEVNSFARLHEIGYQEDHNPWVFTEYNGIYGWIMTKDENNKDTVFYEQVAAKPVIYLYPEKETDVHVELELTEANLSTTYPKYNNGWDVTAYPNGSLLNKADGTHHKYLFWDAVNCRTRFDLSKGFCVAGSDTEDFLKEKLTYMGLTEEEMNEFIVYWLPRMEHNAYNLISFQKDAYTNSAKLDITPTPDSLLRIFMTYVPLEDAMDVQPQQLETFQRKGFTVVEWGGCEIKS
ncbi:dockerin type I repeat-containing protein [Ruminococcus sp.]|uniref:dockerin type I repeat-containing protein n=1 Tax=Ruminococcus sp. TaxID=41978 RepID=UPI0025EB770C|nr:dockerin type I repeat-containing protein [Ruminococcus sp.]